MESLNRSNYRRYAFTAWLYDILDFPWELQYRRWRPELLRDVDGKVLESGVGTGRNLKYYPADVDLTAMDLSPAMLRRASNRCCEARCKITFMQEDASRMQSIRSGKYDWLVSFFLCCVMPAELQEQAVSEIARVLKPGVRFRLLEMKYSENPKLRKRQDRFAPFVRMVYGAGFDRHTLRHVQKNPLLKVTGTRYLKHDVYLLIEGVREDWT
jgi:ubiquinone/menaquinone biosynthesis C-methylase UbiE